MAAGNAVIVKPASVTPLASIRMTELLLEAGVPGLSLIHILLAVCIDISSKRSKG